MRRTEQSLTDVLRERADDVDPEAVERLGQGVRRAGRDEPTRRPGGVSLVAAAAAVVTVVGAGVFLLPGVGTDGSDQLTGPSPRPGVTSQQEPDPTDCVSGFRFEGREYLLVTGPSVRSVAPGPRLGTGRFVECPDGSRQSGRSDADDGVGGSGGGSREVFGLAGVPRSQAIVLSTAGAGSVLASTEVPADGWDADLMAFFESAGSPLAD